MWRMVLAFTKGQKLLHVMRKIVLALMKGQKSLHVMRKIVLTFPTFGFSIMNLVLPT